MPHMLTIGKFNAVVSRILAKMIIACGNHLIYNTVGAHLNGA